MHKFLLISAMLLASICLPSHAEGGQFLAVAFEREVDKRLEVPPEARAQYAQLLETALKNAATQISVAQYILVLDRNPNVQAIFLYWLDAQAAAERLHFIGAAPISTGKPGKFEHFITPLGVFAHTPEFMDYRAEGTLNSLGIRGLGRKGMRVYDFGWRLAERGWGKGGQSPMRLLLHATDPDRLEKHLGKIQSKGCVRISAALDSFIDRYGLLDADYEQALAQGKKFWVLRPDRTPTPWSGRYMVIVDSESASRPDWSPQPVTASAKPKTSKKTAPATPD